MGRPPGQKTDKKELSKMEYLLILSRMDPPHWRPLFELLDEIGLRIGEALKIERGDLANGRVKAIRSKRSDHLEQWFPISLGLYIRLQSLSLSHKESRLWPYTEKAAELALKKAATKACVRLDKNGNSTVHSHLFRRTVARRALKTDFGDNANAATQLVRVQKMLGHKRIQSTMAYLEATEEEAQEGFGIMNRGIK